MVKGRLPTLYQGLDFWNSIVEGKFETNEKSRKLENIPWLSHSIPVETRKSIKVIAYKKEYSLETISTFEGKEFILYDEKREMLTRSYELNKIKEYFISNIKLKKS